MLEKGKGFDVPSTRWSKGGGFHTFLTWAWLTTL